MCDTGEGGQISFKKRDIFFQWPHLTDKLVEMSQDPETWRKLVVACVDLQPSDWRKNPYASSLCVH